MTGGYLVPLFGDRVVYRYSQHTAWQPRDGEDTNVRIFGVEDVVANAVITAVTPAGDVLMIALESGGGVGPVARWAPLRRSFTDGSRQRSVGWLWPEEAGLPVWDDERVDA